MSGDFFDEDDAPVAAPSHIPSRLNLGAGIHDIPMADYLADPCEFPSLRSGDIQTLLTATPRHFVAGHPKLSAGSARIDSLRMDLGSIVHKLVLGKGDAVRVGEFKDWKTKAAQAFRDGARADGCIPTLEKTYAKAKVIAASATRALVEHFGVWPFGETEQTLIWSEDITTREGETVTVFGRVRPDIIDARGLALVLDVKSTEVVLSDDGIEGRLTDSDGRTVIQAAWQMRAARALFPDFVGRLQHAHVFVETAAPFEARINDTPAPLLELADRRCTRAMERFAELLTNGEPANGWPRKRLGMRTWMESKWLAEEESAFQ